MNKYEVWVTGVGTWYNVEADRFYLGGNIATFDEKTCGYWKQCAKFYNVQAVRKVYEKCECRR